jgi:uncharacterized membrane protein YdjX (TVP38/TMEM64 family)
MDTDDHSSRKRTSSVKQEPLHLELWTPMKLPVKIFLFAALAALMFLLTFVFWGALLEGLLTPAAFAERLAGMPGWGWVLGLVALVVDLVLPVPATGVMAALGQVYGFGLGWLVGAGGSLLAGLIGYGLVRAGGDRCARWLCTPQELDEFRSAFEKWGGWAIIASRALPILPEVMVVLAGLARMRMKVLLPALLAGTLPVTALCAWWGSRYGQEAPGANFLVAVLVPLLLWAVLVLVKGWRRRQYPPRQANPEPKTSSPKSTTTASKT